MSYKATVFRILIASPSDVKRECEVVSDVIYEWNNIHSYVQKVILLPVKWETHAAPQMGSRPQEIINTQVVDDCDLLVGVFWTRLGSPTGVAESGTTEEIERFLRSQKQVMLYFSSVPFAPDSIDPDQYLRLKLFKQKCYHDGLVESYESTDSFRDKFKRQLTIKMNTLLEGVKNQKQAYESNEKLEQVEINILKYIAYWEEDDCTMENLMETFQLSIPKAQYYLESLIKLNYIYLYTKNTSSPNHNRYIVTKEGRAFLKNYEGK